MAKSTVVRIKTWIWKLLADKSKEHFGRAGSEQEYLAMILTTTSTKTGTKQVAVKKKKIYKNWGYVEYNKEGYMAEHFAGKSIYTPDGWVVFNYSTKDKVEEIWKFASIMGPVQKNDEFWTLLVCDTGDEPEPTDEMEKLLEEIFAYRKLFLDARAPQPVKPKPKETCQECEWGRDHLCKFNGGKFIPRRIKE